MDAASLSFGDVANIASFIVPGYFAIRAYCWVHSRVDKDFPKLLIESVALSLPIVGAYNDLWTHFHHKIYITSVRYFLPLLIASLILGYLFGKLRNAKWTKAIAKKLLLPGPSDDFVKAQFAKLDPDALVTVTLKDGKIFWGVRKESSVYRRDEAQWCYFDFIAWYNEKTGKWDKRKGSLIISLEEIEYIETKERLPA